MEEIHILSDEIVRKMEALLAHIICDDVRQYDMIILADNIMELLKAWYSKVAVLRLNMETLSLTSYLDEEVEEIGDQRIRDIIHHSHIYREIPTWATCPHQETLDTYPVRGRYPLCEKCCRLLLSNNLQHSLAFLT